MNKYLINKLVLKDFGKFKEREIDFNSGLNIIVGDNEKGKTTLFEAIKYLFTGIIPAKKESNKYINSLTSIKAYMGDSSVVNRQYIGSIPEGILTSDSGSLKIGNNPIYNLDRNLMDYLNVINAEDLRKIDEEKIYSIVDIFSPSTKKTTEVLEKIENRKRELYTNRKNSKREINLIKEDIRCIKENYSKAVEDHKIKLKEKKEIDFYKITEGNVSENFEGRVNYQSIFMLKLFSFMALLTLAFTWYKVYFLAISLIFILGSLFLFYNIRKKGIKNPFNLSRSKCNKINLFIENRDLIEDNYVPEDLRSELVKQEKRLKEKLFEYNTYELLRQVIELARDNTGSTNLDLLIKGASYYFNKFTNSSYTKVFIVDKVLHAEGKKGIFTIDKLSEGTKSQLYLAFRFSACDIVYEDDTIPILFDEAFVYWDDTRLSAAIEMLKDIANNRQIFVFSKRRYIFESYLEI